MPTLAPVFALQVLAIIPQTADVTIAPPAQFANDIGAEFWSPPLSVRSSINILRI